MILQKIKEILPKPVIDRLIRIRARTFGYERRYKDLPTAEVFDRIYRDGEWGRDEQGNTTSGWGSHAEAVIEPYIRAVSDFLDKLDSPVAVDLGCGDFNVGSRFLPYVKQYIACDISSVILERNRLKYSADNLEFKQVNLAEDELPAGDVAFVRQVLQHLGNEDVRKFVDKINDKAPYKYLVVTEHIPADTDFVPNRDKPSGPEVRLIVDSGVDLTAPPFNLKFRNKTTLVSVPDSHSMPPSKIETVIYELI